MPEELEPFDARAYLEAGDWQSALVKRGWHQAPGNLESVRKDYFSPLGWRIHVWVERESRLGVTPEDTLIVAFGPNGTKLGGIWVTNDAALGDVDRLERLIQLDRPYEVVADNVARFLGAIPTNESEEDFDPRAYFAGYTGLMLSMGYESAGELAFAKVIQSPTVTFKVYVDGASDGHPGYLHVEGRPNDWMATGTWKQSGEFRTLLTHAFDNDPPTDYLKALDAKLTGFNGTFEQIEGELTRDKSTLLALSDRAWKARKHVESLVNKLLDSEEAFDPREYVLSAPTIEMFSDELAEMGWTLERPDTNFGWKWTKDDYEINGVMCNLSLYILPEFPHEAHVQVQANYTDDNGFEHWDMVEQEHGWWEMEPGESVADYTARMEDGMARNLRVPDVYEPEGPEEDWARDR